MPREDRLSREVPDHPWLALAPPLIDDGFGDVLAEKGTAAELAFLERGERSAHRRSKRDSVKNHAPKVARMFFTTAAAAVNAVNGSL